MRRDIAGRDAQLGEWLLGSIQTIADHVASGRGGSRLRRARGFAIPDKFHENRTEKNEQEYAGQSSEADSYPLHQAGSPKAMQAYLKLLSQLVDVNARFILTAPKFSGEDNRGP